MNCGHLALWRNSFRQGIGQEELKSFPDAPGVYMIRDREDNILYIGKAKNLCKRLEQHFNRTGKDPDPKHRLMVEKSYSVEYVVCSGELEALILEDGLIKRHQPPFNVNLRDGKTYPCIEISSQEYPALRIVRNASGGSRVFGPYTDVKAARRALQMVRRMFRLRRCSRDIKRSAPGSRPCIYHETGGCMAPCQTDMVSREEYLQAVSAAGLLLSGRVTPLIRKLHIRMQKAANGLEFEKAAELRDDIRALEHLKEKQRAIGACCDRDVIAVKRDGLELCLTVIIVRKGIIRTVEHNIVSAVILSEQELFETFIREFYCNSAPPELIIAPELLSEDSVAVCRSFLKSRGLQVRVNNKPRGDSAAILGMAGENAREALRQFKKSVFPEALNELKEALALPRIPERIEFFDISTTQGVESVGAMSVAINGRITNREFRRWKIKTVDGQDDFAMLGEILRRHSKRIEAGEAVMPDLFIVDGGPLQLASAIAALRGMALSDDTGNLSKCRSEASAPPVAALAKTEETLFDSEGRKVPLPLSSESMRLVRALRDEAHRFAISFHRRRRQKSMLAGQLEAIPGIGPVRRRALLIRFGSVEKVKTASMEELCSVLGNMTGRRVYEAFHRTIEDKPA